MGSHWQFHGVSFHCKEAGQIFISPHHRRGSQGERTFFFPEVLESTGSDYVSAIMEQIMVVNGMGRNRIIGFSQSQSTP